MQKILVTDSLFISKENELQLENAGFSVSRLDKPEASEDELCEAVQGKVGYILGGTEKVTEKVIDSADILRAIVFTGVDFRSFIPGWKTAKEKGILLGDVPDGPTQAVAEWSIAATLKMNRGFFELGKDGGSTFKTTPGIAGLTCGIIGLGRIGTQIASMLNVFQPKSILYYSRDKKPQLEQKIGVEFSELKELLQKSDIVYLCVSDEAGSDFFGQDEVRAMKSGALLVSFAHPGIVRATALFEGLSDGRIRTISDYPFDEKFSVFTEDIFYSFKASNAFNTKASLKLVSDKATALLIQLLNNRQHGDRLE